MNNEQLSVSEYIDRLLVKNIYAPIERDGIIEGIAVVNADGNNVDIEAIIRETGIPQNVFLGFNGKKTITVLSGLSFPISFLSKIREEAEKIWGDRMQTRSKINGQLKEFDFVNGGMTVVQEKPMKKRLNRLDTLRGLRKEAN